MKKMRFEKRHIVALLCVIAGATVIFAHAIRLTSVPRGLYQDESAIAVNAIDISQTGRDEYGTVLPVFFKSFGDYKAPVYIYAASAMEGIFGPSVEALRMTSVLFFLLMAGAFAWLAALLSGKDARITLAAILMIGFLPWLFTISRIGFEVISQGAMLMLSLVMIWKSFEHADRKHHHAAIAGVLLGVTAYAYPTSRVLVPLLLLIVLALYARRATWKATAFLLLGFLVALIPFAFFAFASPEGLLSRFQGITYVFSDKTVWEKISIFFGNYVQYFSPKFLLLEGDHNLRHATGFGGMLSFPVFALGITGMIAVAWKPERSPKFWLLVFLLLLISPVAAALTQDGTPHALRSMPMPIAWLCFALEGSAVLLRGHASGALKFLFWFAVVALCYEGALYTEDYFTNYPAVSAGAFENDGVLEAATLALKQKPDDLLVSDKFNGINVKLIQAVFHPNIGVRGGPSTAVPGGCLIQRSDEGLPASEFAGKQIPLSTDRARLICYPTQ